MLEVVIKMHEIITDLWGFYFVFSDVKVLLKNIDFGLIACSSLLVHIHRSSVNFVVEIN